MAIDLLDFISECRLVDELRIQEVAPRENRENSCVFMLGWKSYSMNLCADISAGDLLIARHIEMARNTTTLLLEELYAGHQRHARWAQMEIVNKNGTPIVALTTSIHSFDKSSGADQRGAFTATLTHLWADAINVDAWFLNMRRGFSADGGSG